MSHRHGEGQKTDQQTGKNEFQQQLAWKVRGAKFYKFLQPVGLKTWSFKCQPTWFWESSKDIGAILGGKTGQTACKYTVWKYMKGAWSTQWGSYLFICEHVPERQCSWREPSRRRELGRGGGCHFPFLSRSINTEPATYVNQHNTNTDFLTPSPQVTPKLHSGGTTLPRYACLSPSMVGPLPQKSNPNPLPTPCFPPRQFFRALVPVARGIISQRRAHLVETHILGQGPNISHNR